MNTDYYLKADFENKLVSQILHEIYFDFCFKMSQNDKITHYNCINALQKMLNI